MNEVWYKIKRILVQLAHFQKRNKIKRYGIPLFLTSIIFFVKQYFHAFLGDHAAFLLASFVVAAGSWYGGLGPGILATFLAAFTVYFVYLSNGSIFNPHLIDFIVIAIFLIEGIIISIVSEARYEMENQKDEFIGFVSHELKNPLATIKGFAQLTIRSSKQHKYEQIEGYADEINIQSDKILELINDLLDITKIEIGKFTYNNEIFNIHELFKEVILHQRMISPKRTIELKGYANKTFFGDKYRIRQVVVNLLTNALKYSPDTTGIIVKMMMQKDSLVIKVTDHGLGIPKNEQLQIFDRYYRTRAVQGKKSEGLGLGLYISKQIVKQHHGKIWVKSQPGKGSTFFVSLPVNSQKSKKS